MTRTPEDQHFRVDLGGLIALLSKHLYTTPGVYIRELIQNAMDALVAREVVEAAATDRVITITPFAIASGDSPADVLTVTDSGIGITGDQVQELLASVGASSKDSEILRRRRSYIGQFGIGLLSCFLVADEIRVISRSATGGAPIEWIGRDDGSYTLTSASDQVPVGTSVSLRPRPDMVGWLRAEQVLPLACKYAEFLPAKIRVQRRAGYDVITHPYPWRHDFPTHRSQVIHGNPPRYGGVGVGRQFDAIEVREPSLDLDGVVYIQSLSTVTSGGNHIYVHDMLVSNDDEALMPHWAFFAWAAFNCDRLEPTASRESLVQNATYRAVREALGRAVLRWLQALADSDPERFSEFVQDNELELRSAATEGPGQEKTELAAVVLPMLTMQTTEGPMRIVDIVKRSSNVLHTPYMAEYRTIASFNPRGRLVVNASHALDHEVLLTLPLVMPGVTVTRVYPASEIAALRAPTYDAEAALSLEVRASSTLDPLRCRAAVRVFPSTDLPAVFIERGELEVGSPGYAQSGHLVLNWDNRVIRGLAETSDGVVFDRILQLLYVQARMSGQYDGPADRQLLSAALDDVLLLAVGIGDGRL
jgi:molecular chaperone HtpG